eukprot:gene8279-17035_t
MSELVDEILKPLPNDSTWDIDCDPVVNVFSCGWLEDGRCGYIVDEKKIQTCPRPIFALKSDMDKKKKQYVCQKICAGSRHTLFLMINCRPENTRSGLKSKKVMIVGLNQVALCEQPGLTSPANVPLHKDEYPIDVIAGHGTSFILTQIGNLYSCGHGRYGMLGHGDDMSCQIPRQVLSLERLRIKKMAVGEFHVAAITDIGHLYCWGRNHMGQLGLGLESEQELLPRRVEHHMGANDSLLDVSCGKEHTVAIIKIVRKDNSVHRMVFAWGDHSRGQLGSGDEKFKARPQEMRWVTTLLKQLKSSPIAVAAGAHHNLVLTRGKGQVIVWGGGEYGQLGSGFIWDEPRPRVLPGLKDVLRISAGLRHSVVLKESDHPDFPEVWAWGYNGYGELGLGDTDIRLQPTHVMGLDRARVKDVSCGDRHTVFVTNHRPLTARDDPILGGYFEAIE